MATNILLAQPKISGEIRETALYGAPDPSASRSLLLIGHSNSDQQNWPYQVVSMKSAINWLKADSNSPLLRGLLEAWNAGCRNIWLYSVAPMSEYVANVADRTTPKFSNNLNFGETGSLSFYAKYNKRLNEVVYPLLSGYDDFEIIVPIEISLCQTGGIDFLTPFAMLCATSPTNGMKTMGVIGTRATAYDQALFNTMTSLPALTTMETHPNEIGVPIMAVVGEGIVTSSQMSRTYSASYAVQVGALLATVPLDRSIFGYTFSNVAGLAGFELNEAQITQLTQAKLNPVLRTQRGKRGKSYETFLVTDNSLAPTGSDFWSMNQVRLVTWCCNRLTFISKKYIGTTKMDIFKQDIYDELDLMKRNDQVKDYFVKIELVNKSGQARIYVCLTPVFGIRNIYFTVETGPGS